ncbi:hypothetical protein REPUB_Repub09cG0008500 [Reevesia pubescens]
MESSPSGSLKRSFVANPNQKMSCLVDGCKSDLGKYREYYRRHRVCKTHSKEPFVIVGGEEQRFCQQCRRFHVLGEFDEEKRSCRKRLDGHNRRRRKSRQKSLYMSHGSTILQFNDPLMYATPAMVYDCYEYFNLVDRLRSPNPLVCINRGENRESDGLLTNDREMINRVSPVVSACRGLANVLASSEGGTGTGSHKMQANGISQSFESYCALSLLSPLISMQPNTNNLIARVSSSHSNMSEPLSSSLIPDRNQVSNAGSGNTILQAWPEGFLDDQAWIRYKCS